MIMKKESAVSKKRLPYAKIIVHCIVRNEARFIWYSLMSVLQYVDLAMVWDTGSTDDTVKIVSAINSPKIKFKQVGGVTVGTFTQVSQKMLEQTPKQYTWMLVLDGDEVWPAESIEKVTAFAKSHPEYESIVVRSNNLVGDIYHRLPESAGQYHLAGHKGHLALRMVNIRQIKGLHFDRPHGQRGLFDDSNQLIQDRPAAKIKFLDVAYHHATHLPRSNTRSGDLLVPKRAGKLKYELGQSIPISEIPQVFFIPGRPAIVPPVTQKASLWFWLVAAILTPLRQLKRMILTPKSGY